MTGLIVRGSNNIFYVRPLDSAEESDLEILAGKELECRIKGKVLKGVQGYYNPLAPGDKVQIEVDPLHPGKALITELVERKNAFTRFNQKGMAPQLLAANVDMVLCVTTPASPPFRPRFLDRVLVQAERAQIPAVIIVNKWDLHEGDYDVDERLEDYRRIGYRLLLISALTGEGMDDLAALLSRRVSVMVGQSGVGKSSLINKLAPHAELKVGDLCEKYERGSHTTTMSRLIQLQGSADGGCIIDTPGVRRLMPDGIGPDDLALYFREFAPLVGQCTYGLSCSHRIEPGCKIMEAVAAGVIHEDRYESYLRLTDELKELY
ncbi:MAG TPA: ribosome small subunit-dependent GTPase A [Treponema sp.]|nr:ribosome small subunit-dependent GTPase A [Treponema sp.]HPC72121.1 ribosome small subunit-dependent GTPase A [Treponema sp.]HRS03521.1 ribosome small subunit-dependent GTPase A [Treponema sp.]HRU28069.1 ribosome small subunit-dependent GTPase A [Treponema sp.]